MSTFCSNCSAPLEAGTKFCGACGSLVEIASTPPATTPLPRNSLSTTNLVRRYPALRIIALLFKILAVLIAIGGVLAGLSAASITSSLPNSVGIGAAGSAIGFVIVLTALCYALFLWASAEMIHVLIDIEENTRRSSGFTG